MKITFDEKTHTYLVNGSPYPRVTRILQSAGYVDLSNIPKSNLEYARERGSNVHVATAYFDRGILDEDTVGEAERPYFEAYKKFIVDCKPTNCEIECPVASKLIRFVGTLDRVIVLGGVKAILEIKNTAKLNRAAHVQTMAYFMAYNEMNPKDKAKARFVLRLLGSGDYELIPCTKNVEDKTAFLNALGVHNWKEKYL